MMDLWADYGVNVLRTLAIAVAGVAGALTIQAGQTALALVVVFTAIGLFLWSVQEHVQTVRTVKAVRLASSTGAETEITLPDGSRHVIGAVPLVAPKGTHFVLKDGKQTLQPILPPSEKDKPDA